MEEDEIYDEGFSPVVPSGLSALKSKFEKPSPTTKPAIGSKPAVTPKSANIAAKFGAATSKTASAKPSNTAVGPGRLKPAVGSAGKPDKVTANSSESSDSDKTSSGVPSLTKRNSKVNIPAAFQNAEAPPPLDKPKPETKPVPKWKQKQDDTNNNKDTVTNSNVSKDTKAMLNKDTKPATDLPKKPINLPSSAGNVKDKASKLFGDKPPGELKNALRPVQTKTSENSKQITPKGIAGKVGSVDAAELRSKFGLQVKSKRKSVKSIVRSKDDKKFHKVDIQDIKSESVTPVKPNKLGIDIDWEKLAADFKNLQADLESRDGKSGIVEIEEEDYDDIANIVRPNTRAISIIQPMTEDEEREWVENGFDGLMDPDDLPPPPPELLEPLEEYDDVGVLLQNGGDEEDGEELYEPLPDEPIDEPPPRPQKGVLQNGTLEKPPPPPPTEQIDHKKDAKESEKERKRKEKEEKELSKKKEKELKKKQEDLKQLMSKYKIDAEGLTQSVGKGRVIKTMKGSKKDIPVQQGDKVDIIRMVDNDKGKWLIRILNTDKDDHHQQYSSRRKSRRTVGYVDATNVEVDTDIIRDVMEGSNLKPSFSTSVSVTSLPSSDGDDEEGETYEAVEGEAPSGFIEDEIYEECN